MRLDDLTDWQRILLRELKISFVMRRNTHYRARAVFNQHVVCYPHRYALAAERIDGKNPGVESFLLLFLFAARPRVAFSDITFRANVITSSFNADASSSSSMSGCSAESTIAVAPKIVSMRVVNTRIFLSLSFTAKSIYAPSLRPTQSRWRLSTFSGQPLSICLMSIDELLRVFSDAQKPLFQISLLHQLRHSANRRRRTTVHWTRQCPLSDTS